MRPAIRRSPAPRGGSRLPRLLVMAALLAACRQVQGITEEEYGVIRTWLTCEECPRELRDRVAAIGPRAIPFLDTALESLPQDRIDNVRSQLAETFTLIEGGAVDSATFVDHHLANFEAAAQKRAARSLADLGAFDVLRRALDQGGVRGYRQDVIDVLRGELHRAPDVPVGAGIAQAWEVTEPAEPVSMCNGSGRPCAGLRVDTLEAVASGPSGALSSPWVSVFFYLEDPAAPGSAVLVGQAAEPAVMDDGVATRRWIWRLLWGASGLPPGSVEVFAVGVDASGDAFRTQGNPNVTIVEGR